ncbi:hypothetical protein C3942_07495 [Solimonas fluminis]|uniref:Uncharacterized protein n=1 Tax=Solimonas fluminis TaxID=2086571 RepID=A0A2S5TIG4_9GAMM|nr:hypothetical protein C3942_07495 [Solimonas fluminis]
MLVSRPEWIEACSDDASVGRVRDRRVEDPPYSGYRFNHRDEDLKPLLYQLLSHISTREIQSILVRN